MIQKIPDDVRVVLGSDEAEACAVDSDLDCESDEDLV